MARIRNIEFRLTQTIGENPRDYVEIVKWFPNEYYGHENDFVKDGEWYRTKTHGCRIHESCFQNPESCYVLATIDIREEPDVKSVGLRPFQLHSQEDADYREIVRQAYEFAANLWLKQNNLD